MSLRDALKQPVVQRRTAEGAPAGTRVTLGATTLADLLAPAGVNRRHPQMVQVGDSYVTTLRATTFPTRLQLGWLNDPRFRLDEPGVIVHQRIEPVDDGLARRLLGRSVHAARGSLAGDLQSGADEDVHAEQGMAAADALRRDLAAGEDRLFRYGVFVTVAAATDEARDAGVDGVRYAGSQQGLVLQAPPLKQWDGYVQSLPLGRDELGLLHDTSGWVVAMGLPTAAPGLRGRGGLPVFWGLHPRTHTPVFWDRWQATNPHALVIAESGNGKTYAMSGLLAQEVALGEDAVLILDPKRNEYWPLVRGLGGAYVSLSALADYHINPLELPRLMPERIRTIQELHEDLLGQRISLVRALLAGELRANGTPVDGWGVALIERAIQEAYARRGILADDLRTFTRRMPVFSDVRAAVQLLADGESHAQARADGQAIARALALFTDGTLGRLFNHPSNIPTDNPLLALDVSALLDGDDPMLGRVIPVVVADFFRITAINRPTRRRYHLVLDEAHALINTESGGHTMQNIYRTGRSLGFKATVITQGVKDLQRSAHTETLLENAKTKLVLGLNRDSQAVQYAAEVLNLNEHEAAYLAGCALRPEGSYALLLADGERAKLLIPPWPETLDQIITTPVQGGRRPA